MAPSVRRNSTPAYAVPSGHDAAARGVQKRYAHRYLEIVVARWAPNGQNVMCRGDARQKETPTMNLAVAIKRALITGEQTEAYLASHLTNRGAYAADIELAIEALVDSGAIVSTIIQVRDASGYRSYPALRLGAS